VQPGRVQPGRRRGSGSADTDGNLAGYAVIITAASSGIGRLAALMLREPAQRVRDHGN
jgi:hypothetical protein